MSKPEIPGRADYGVFYPITTRWSDNDIYGHVNNVTYYSYFDTVANRYLIEEGGLDISDGTIVGFVVNSGCEYH
ncbi:MAG: acyl-CoA thioesterase, partial [Halioglobus sp.]|nr:acyl-CoA thioesterase [Halioglobus sp.]